MRDVSIDELLAGIGLSGDAARRARAVLEAAGLTNARKQRMAEGKTGPAVAAIARSFVRLCATCAGRMDAGGREVLRVAPRFCERCGGSSNDRALLEMAERCDSAGVRRLVLVGGSPSLRKDFSSLGDRLELRLVDGTARRTQAEANHDLDWADLVVVCGSSELAHKVSRLYTRSDSRGKVFTAPRRGIEAIAQAVSRHLELR